MSELSQSATWCLFLINNSVKILYFYLVKFSFYYIIRHNFLDCFSVSDIYFKFFVYFQKTHEKAGLFNLNETDDLTHYGQSLAEIEKFEDPVDSDSDEEGIGKIDGKWQM